MGFKLHEGKKASNGGLFLLFALVLVFLSFESRARAETETRPTPPDQVMGAGSLLEISDDLDYGLSREKRFCSGQDTGFFRSLLTQDCCTLRINALEAPLDTQLVIKKGLRKIKRLDEQQRFSILEGRYELILNCGSSAPTAAKLETALGSRVRIHEVVVAPQLVEKRPVDGKAVTVEVTSVIPRGSEILSKVETLPEEADKKIESPASGASERRSAHEVEARVETI